MPATALYKKVETLRKENKLEAAQKALAKHAGDFDDTAAYHFHAGQVSECAGEWPVALESYDKALAIDPQCKEALFRKAYMADMLGDDEEAYNLYRQLIEGNPCYDVALFNFAAICEERDETDEAIFCCKKILESEPDNERATRFLSNLNHTKTMYVKEEKDTASERLKRILSTPVSEFELSVRSRNCLKRMRIHTLGDLVKKTEAEMLSYKNFGETSLQEIKDLLRANNLRLGQSVEAAETEEVYLKKEAVSSQEAQSIPLEQLDLSLRSRRGLQLLGIHTVGELTAKSSRELLSVKNIGMGSLKEIQDKLRAMGLELSQ